MLFQDGKVYPRLKHLRIPLTGSSAASLNIVDFPELRSFNCLSRKGRVSLDFSDHPQPLELDLVNFLGEAKFPAVPMKKLKMTVGLLVHPSFCSAARAAEKLEFSSQLVADTWLLYASLPSGPSRSGGRLGSATLCGLTVSSSMSVEAMGYDQNISLPKPPLEIGAFPLLTRLDLLVPCSTHLFGGDLPSLRILSVAKSHVALVDRFDNLEELSINEGVFRHEFALDAPRLKRLTVDAVPNAYLMTVDHARCPLLSFVKLMLPFCEDFNAKQIPTFDPTGVIPCHGILLRLRGMLPITLEKTLRRCCGKTTCPHHGASAPPPKT